jgi:hypothetical protein
LAPRPAPDTGPVACAARCRRTGCSCPLLPPQRPAPARQRCTSSTSPATSTAVAPRRLNTPLAIGPGRLATPVVEMVPAQQLMQDNLVQAADRPDADQHRRLHPGWPRASPASDRPRPHAIPSHIPKRQLHLSWSLRTTVPARICSRPTPENGVKLRSTPPRCMRRWRPLARLPSRHGRLRAHTRVWSGQ